MTRRPYLLAIDQGTTSTRAILFDSECSPQAAAQRELPQIFPNDGWVEHDPEAIWAATVEVCRRAMAEGGASAADIAAIGITNQRETTVVWERAGGRPIHNAIVWQDRRTAEVCRRLTADGHAETVSRKSGLVIDPYFSGTKIAWLLDNVTGARAAAEAGKLAFGTIDSFLLWRLTGGRVHATDATNASRTMAFNIHTQEWDDELLEMLRIPRAILPEVMDNVADFGTTEAGLLGGGITVGGMAGDQQAATVGQACFAPGMIKSTYGTGCFALLNTGDKAVASHNKLLTTVAYRMAGKTTYAVEGSIFVAGAAIQWLRDGLKVITSAPESEKLARSVADAGGVYMVPAFTGLGAPYWDPDARGALFGLTRDTGIAQVVRAALEAVCYQTRDLMRAMEDDGAARPMALRVDGGMVANDWLVQHLADILGLPVERPTVIETTAAGAAFLAGLKAGVFASLDDISARWKRDCRCEPKMEAAMRDRLYAGWQDAVRRVRCSAPPPQK
ncbi:glycerol kinase GlpK [Shumkonia mesophila]|uniref:glycerol kinase GlpK n=1 Tax=Shumkonia mesophila TaxID=2838854 RepID=UPI002934F555|nr:glycerol kinase GlpK [Shumkonia mesophila]